MRENDGERESECLYLSVYVFESQATSWWLSCTMGIKKHTANTKIQRNANLNAQIPIWI